MYKIIAERKLYFSFKEKKELKPFSIKVSEVYIDENKINGMTCFACDVIIEGLNEKGDTKYGMDSVQVLNMATNLEPLLKRLNKDYDLFWHEGEPYFDTNN